MAAAWPFLANAPVMEAPRNTPRMRKVLDAPADATPPAATGWTRHALLICAYGVSLLAPLTGQTVVAALLYWTVYRHAPESERRRVIWIGLAVAVAETLLIAIAIQSGLVAHLFFSAGVVQGPEVTVH